MQMSERCYKSFQDNYKKLVASQVIISMSKDASADVKIVLDGLNFLNSFWMFYGVNVEIIKCNAASLVLELKNITNVTIQNCTFGNWTFNKVQNTLIENCNNVFDDDFSTSLNFYNSSAFLVNIRIKNENLTDDLNGIYVHGNSLLHIEQSTFVNNTVKKGIIKTLKSSSLIMSNCTALGNHATYYPGVIYANESFVHLKNTIFNGNMAIKGGAIYIDYMSFLLIKNCTFKNNSVDRASGIGGAILSTNNSSLDICCSVFDGNKAYQGGAIDQETSTTKLNQCSFFGNYESAIAGAFNSEVYILNSIFQNNLVKHQGGAVAVAYKSVLNVSNTTFENNTQISTGTLNVYQTIYAKTNRGEGGGAILLFESVGNISKSWFRNNSASYWCGSILDLNSSLSISNTTFENNVAGVYGGAICSAHSFINIEYSTFKKNRVLNLAFGQGGSLLLQENSTTNISNVIFSECHASRGGAIKSKSTTIIMSNCFVIANTGSAIYLIGGTSLEIDNSTFSNNSTPEDGGAIVGNDCVMKIVNTRFNQNRATQGGGGVVNFYETSKFNAHNCSFTYNTAYAGGVISACNSDFSISDSNFSNNLANQGGVAYLSYGYISMTNCLINNQTVPGDGGVIHAQNETLLMSNCLVFNNFANGDAGVLRSISSEIVITTSIFIKNRALGSGGVFFIIGGATLFLNSSFEENIAGSAGGMLAALDRAVINITKSFCFENQGGYVAGAIIAQRYTKILISDTNISQNSAYRYGALYLAGNSVLELNGSQVEDNQAKTTVRALLIANHSLFVGINSLFKGNKAYQDSSIFIKNSTVYLEKCTFMENQMTYFGGTISTTEMTKVKVSDTIFTQNERYNLFYSAMRNHFINIFETHRCLFVQGDISLKSYANNFEEVAVKEKVIGQFSFLNQSFFTLQETPYASSKLFYILNILNC